MPELPYLNKLSLDGYELDVSHYLTRVYDDISDAANELPAIVEWVNEQRQVYYEMKLIAKSEVDEAEAIAYFALTNVVGDNFDQNYPGAKRNDTSLGHAVAIDPAVKAAKRKFAVISGYVARLDGLMSSFQSRLDLLRSSEATRRGVFNEQSRPVER